MASATKPCDQARRAAVDHRDRAVQLDDRLDLLASYLVNRAADIGTEQHGTVGHPQGRPHRVAFELDALGIPARSDLTGRGDERARGVAGVELLIALDGPRRRYDGIGADREQADG